MDQTDIDVVQKDSVWGLFDYGGVEKGGLELFGKKKKKRIVQHGQTENSGIRRS